MARKPLGKDQFGIQKVMRGSDYFGDAMGQFALNAINGMVGQLTYFYTDKAGLAAAVVATVFMITKIIDAFTDIIMGNIIDHTKPGKERYRPWLLKMSIPAALLTLLLFTAGKFHVADCLYAGDKSVDDICRLHGDRNSIWIFNGSMDE